MTLTKKLITGPRLIVGLVLLVLAVAIAVATRKPAVEVEMAQVTRGPLSVTVSDLAETRVRDLYMVSAPVTGELLRVPLKPGARVVAGRTVLARIQPVSPGPLDARTVAQIEANIRTLGAQQQAARARVDEANAALLLADRQLGRIAQLHQHGFATLAALDEARAARDRARAGVRSAREAENAARESIAAARAGLIAPDTAAPGRGVVDVRAPVSGYVLSVPQESERPVAAGTPLVALGDPRQLETVTDLLSSDAVRVRPGAAVSIEDWGGDTPLQGRVRLIEPYGFVKISALGVEEQRVNVVIDLVGAPDTWARLGHGFRATVRIETWSARDVVLVPVGALFRGGSDWQVFRVGADGRARATTVQLGQMNDQSAQLLRGLAPGDRIILYPGDKVADGIRVRTREANR